MKPVAVIALCTAALAVSACKMPHLPRHGDKSAQRAQAPSAAEVDAARPELAGPPPGDAPEQTVFPTTPAAGEAPAQAVAEPSAPAPTAKTARRPVLESVRCHRPAHARRHHRRASIVRDERADQTGVYEGGAYEGIADPPLPPPPMVMTPMPRPMPVPQPPPYGVAYGYRAAYPPPPAPPMARQARGGSAWNGGDAGRSEPWRWYRRP